MCPPPSRLPPKGVSITPDPACYSHPQESSQLHFRVHNHVLQHTSTDTVLQPIYIYIHYIYIHKIHITLHIIQQKIFSQILKQVLQHFDFPTIGIPGLAGVAGGGLDAASSAAASQIAAAQPRGVHVGWVQEWKKSKYNALIYRYTMSHSLYYCYCIMIC